MDLRQFLCGVLAIFIAVSALAQEQQVERPPSVSAHLSRPVLQSAGINRTVSELDLRRQYDFLAGLPQAWVEYAPSQVVRSIEGNIGLYLPGNVARWQQGDLAETLLELFGPALLAAGTETLRVTDNKKLAAGRRLIKTEQLIRGIAVRSAVVMVTVDASTGRIERVVADFVPDRGLVTEPTLTAAQAKEVLTGEFGAESEADLRQQVVDGQAELAYILGSNGRPDDSGRFGRLVWVIRFGPAIRAREAWIDALDGSVLGVHPLYRSALQRNVYTSHNQDHSGGTLPGSLTLLFSEGGSSSDATAQAAYANAGATYQAFNSVLGRDSTQDTGNAINVVVHWGTGISSGLFVRAGGQDYLFFGDGTSTPYGSNLDVVAHEFGHGVVRDEAHLDPFPGDGAAALDEGYSDFASTLVDVYQRGGHPASQTWLIGEGLIPGNPSGAHRSWSAPRTFGSAWKDWYPARDPGEPSQGASHGNSTIMGHAFYLLSQGGNHARAGTDGIPTISVPAIGYSKSRDIFYEALKTLQPTAGFPQLRVATVTAANAIYGATEKDAVEKAWDAVGVPTPCTAVPTAPPNLVSELLCPHWRVTMDTVAGAQIYHLQSSLHPSFAFPGTVSGSDVQQCELFTWAFQYLRARSCNVCGCSGWSSPAYIYPWQGECP